MAVLAVTLAVTVNKLRQVKQRNTDRKELPMRTTEGIQPESERGSANHWTGTSTTASRHTYYNDVGSPAQMEEGRAGTYAEVCTEGLSAANNANLRSPYQALDPWTMEKNEYQKIRQGMKAE